jgi:Zn-dependent protease
MMVKQRLGEFRYGFDFAQNSVIGLWGVWGNLIAATLFGIGWMAFPQSYVFGKGVTLNLIMAACSLIPLPQLDGLSIFWGSRLNWVMGILTVAVAAILLMSRSKPGLIIAIAGATAAGFIYIFTGSEK